MTKLLPLVFLISIIFFSEINAQTQLTDFKYRTDDKNSYPSSFVQLGNKILFIATTEAEGRELWLTDGSTTHTKLLKDIYPGSGDGITVYLAENSVILNNQLFFIANDGENGTQIWSTDGTEQGTKPVTNLPNLNTHKLTQVGNYFYFLVHDKNFLQVWRSDGTSKGTLLVKKGLSIWNTPSFEGTANNLFFFTFQPEGSNYSRLWRSDGTESGTYPVTESLTGNGAGPGGTSDFTQYIEFNNELYFVVRSSSLFNYPLSVGIMKTDGTLKNTLPVIGVHEGNTSLISFADVIKINNKLYFSFFQFDYNRLFIWESDGTKSGTKKIYDEYSANFFVPSNLSSDDKNLIFTGKNSRNGTSFLKLELDNYSIKEIKELANNTVKPSFFWPYEYIFIDKLTNNIFLLFEPVILNRQGWKSDLTEINTVPVSQLENTHGATVIGENVYFSSNFNKEGYELWKSDLSFTNLHQLLNINKSKYGIDNFESATINNKIIFRADDGISGSEPWVYDKLSKEKKLLIDIVVGKKSSGPSDFTILNNKVYFSAFSGEFANFDIWQSDGTEPGTVKVSKPADYKQYADIRHLTKSQGKLFFVASLHVESLKTRHEFVCVTDGVKTEVLKDLGENEYGVPLRVPEMVTAANYIYFNVYGDGVDLWRSDGTMDGTVKIKDLGTIRNLTAVDNKVYFTGSDRYDAGYELWQSDGSSTGTAIVKDLEESSASSPDQFINFNGKLVFSAYTQQFGREYWITDGTLQGTLQITDINPGANGSVISKNAPYNYNPYKIPIPADYSIVNGFLYFLANDGRHGTELWRTDGTANGTVLVSDINKGEVGSFPKHFANNKNKIYFSAYSPASGTEIWTTEGTAITTAQLSDLNTGVKGSTASNFIFLDNELFFVAEKNNSGCQLWQYNQNNVTGIQDPFTDNTFSIYPNPTSEYLFVKKDKQKVKNLKIYNLQGQEFRISNDASGKIYVGNLIPDIYFLYAEVDNKITVRRFVKK